MKSFFTLIVAGAALFQGAAAHYRFTKLIVNGQVTGEYQYVRRNTNMNSPVTDLNDDLRCNTGGASGASTSTYTVAAGSTVGFQMDQAIFHSGPALAYLSKAPSTAAAYNGSGGWFKIWQQGPTFNNGGLQWPTDNQSQFTFKLPSNIQAGEYLLRIEHIALHGLPAQFYISCAQLKITGGGSANPSTIQLPSGYVGAPGLTANIYYPPLTSYPMPGPAVYSG